MASRTTSSMTPLDPPPSRDKIAAVFRRRPPNDPASGGGRDAPRIILPAESIGFVVVAKRENKSIFFSVRRPNVNGGSNAQSEQVKFRERI